MTREQDLKPYERLRKYWADVEADEADVQTTAHTEAEIAALEARYDVRLPDDFHAYLLNACPVREVFPNDLYTWWEFDRIKNIPDEHANSSYSCEWTIWENRAKYLYFADYVFWSWAWAINCSDDENRGRVIVLGYGDTRFVADSFSEFVISYCADPKKLATEA